MITAFLGIGSNMPGDVGSPWAIGAEEGGHTDILPELGTPEDFRRLVAKAGVLLLPGTMFMPDGDADAARHPQRRERQRPGDGWGYLQAAGDERDEVGGATQEVVDLARRRRPAHAEVAQVGVGEVPGPLPQLRRDVRQDLPHRVTIHPGTSTAREDLRGGPTRCDASVQRPFQR